nr:MAG TPA: hypothetical protein [Caudoviricetes sp.]
MITNKTLPLLNGRGGFLFYCKLLQLLLSL